MQKIVQENVEISSKVVLILEYIDFNMLLGPNQNIINVYCESLFQSSDFMSDFSCKKWNFTFFGSIAIADMTIIAPSL